MIFFSSNFKPMMLKTIVENTFGQKEGEMVFVMQRIFEFSRFREFHWDNNTKSIFVVIISERKTVINEPKNIKNTRNKCWQAKSVVYKFKICWCRIFWIVYVIKKMLPHCNPSIKHRGMFFHRIKMLMIKKTDLS